MQIPPISRTDDDAIHREDEAQGEEFYHYKTQTSESMEKQQTVKREDQQSYKPEGADLATDGSNAYLGARHFHDSAADT